LLLVAKRMHAVKTAIMTGTTTNGEVMLIGWLLGVFRVTKQLSAFSLQLSVFCASPEL
jgi:hypothetical protein